MPSPPARERERKAQRAAERLGEKERLLADEQAAFDAWYTTHRPDAQASLSNFVVGGSSAVPKATEFVSANGGSRDVVILEAKVSGVRAGGFVVDIHWLRESA